jgi:membrane protease YdiL (CAAX protease family)
MTYKIKPNLKTFILYILVFFVVWLIYTGLFPLFGFSSTQGGLVSGLFLLGKTLIFAGLPYLYITKIRGENFVEFIGLNVINKLIWRRYVVPLVVIIPVTLILIFSGFLKIDQLVYPNFMVWIAGLVVAPITEEVAFRGFLFQEGKKYLTGWVNWLTNIILFILIHSSAWIHYPNKDHQILLFSVSTFFFSFFLIWSFRQTKSIWPPIIVHFINNYLAVFLLT